MTVSDILYSSTTNKNGTGTTQRVYVALADTYPQSGETATDNLVTAIAAGPVFSLFEAARSSGKFKVTSAGDTDAKSFNVEFEYFIPQINATKSKMLGELVNYPCTVVSEDRLGNLRRCGVKYDGCEIDVEEMTEGKNGYLLKGKIEGLSEPPAFIQDDTVIPVF